MIILGTRGTGKSHHMEVMKEYYLSKTKFDGLPDDVLEIIRIPIGRGYR